MKGNGLKIFGVALAVIVGIALICILYSISTKNSFISMREEINKQQAIYFYQFALSIYLLHHLPPSAKPSTLAPSLYFSSSPWDNTRSTLYLGLLFTST